MAQAPYYVTLVDLDHTHCCFVFVDEEGVLCQLFLNFVQALNCL